MSKPIRNRQKIVLSLFIIGILCVIIRYIVIPKLVFPMKYKTQVFQSAKRHGVDPLLIFSIIKAESKFDPNAISNRGAKGLMQIMDKTGEWGATELGRLDFERDQLFDPAVNIEIGSWYVAKLQKQYDGNVSTLLAAYNAGTGNVYKWRNNKKYSLDGVTLDYIPFGETRNYIEKVNRYLKIYRYLYEGGKAK